MWCASLPSKESTTNIISLLNSSETVVFSELLKYKRNIWGALAPLQNSQQTFVHFYLVGWSVCSSWNFSSVRPSENFQSVLLFTTNNPTSNSSQFFFSHFYALFWTCYRLKTKKPGYELKIIDHIESRGHLYQEKFMDSGAVLFTPPRPFSLLSGGTTL